MEYLVMFLIGILFTLVFTRKPIRIEIIHTENTKTTAKTAEELKELEQEMLKEDPKEDNEYEKLGVVLNEVADIMGGSDR